MTKVEVSQLIDAAKKDDGDTEFEAIADLFSKAKKVERVDS